MPKEESVENEFAEASKSAQKQFVETQKKMGDATLEANEEFLKTFEEIGHDVVSSAAAEFGLGLKLSKNLTAAKSMTDAIAACQEWWREEMNARSEDASRLMTNTQKFISTSTRLFSNGWSRAGVST
jgi:hypothetical protein